MAFDEAGLIEARAVRYLEAARVLYGQTGEEGQGFYEPLNYLLGMAAELTLKAFLLRRGVTPKKLSHVDVRHSLTGLLTLAVDNGLIASETAMVSLLQMDKAHSNHAFRYTSNLAPDKATVIFSARPGPAITGIGMLLDYASPNPPGLRSYATSGIDWPLTLPTSTPITSEQLTYWIGEVREHQKNIAELGPV